MNGGVPHYIPWENGRSVFVGEMVLSWRSVLIFNSISTASLLHLSLHALLFGILLIAKINIHGSS